MRSLKRTIIVISAFLLACAPAPAQTVVQGTPVIVLPGLVTGFWNSFTISGLQPQFWNAIGISSTIDYDIRVAGTQSIRSGPNCDFVIADGNAGTPASSPAHWRRYDVGTSNATLQHAANNSMIITGTHTWAPPSASGSIIRSLDFRPTVAGVHTITLSASSGVFWYYFEPNGTATWRTANSANAFAGAGTFTFTVQPARVNQWHAIVLAKNSGPSLGSPTVTIAAPLPDLQPLTLTGPAPWIASGRTHSVSYRIRNNGPAASGAFSASVYISTDNTITSADCGVGSVNIASLAGFSETTGSINVVLASSCSGVCGGVGLRYWGIIVDPTNQVPELNENNNVLAGNTGTLYNTGPFTIEGTIEFEKRLQDANGWTGTVGRRPVADARIEVREVNGTNQNTILVSGATASNGRYSLTVPDNNDPEGGPRDIVVYFWAIQASNGYYEVRNPDNRQTYAGASRVWQDVLGCALLVQDLVATSDPWPGLSLGGIFNIYDTIRRGHRYVRNLPNTATPCRVRVYWSYTYQPQPEPGVVSAYFNGIHPCAGEAEIHLPGGYYWGDEYDDSLILHEYGHAVSRQYIGPVCMGGQHRVHWNWANQYQQRGLSCWQARSLVWNEGWASYFSSAVRGEHFFLDTVGPSNLGNPHALYDWEYPASAWTGADCEGAVTAVLWDIFDSGTNEPHDTLALGFEPTWDMVRNPTYFNTCDLQEFWRGWFAAGLGTRDPLYQIFDDRRIHMIPALSVEPGALGFGTLSGAPVILPLSVLLDGGGSATWSVATASSWLAASPATGQLVAPTGTCSLSNLGRATAAASVTASPAGLPPGAYSGNVTVSATSSLPGGVAFSPLTVPSTMSYAPPSCTMTVSGGVGAITVVVAGPTALRRFGLEPCSQAGAGVWAFVPDVGWPPTLTYLTAPQGACDVDFQVAALAGTAVGVYTGTLRWVGNCNGNPGVTLQTPVIVDVRPALRITTTCPLPSGSVGVGYSTAVVATGGVLPYTWSVSPGLPGGLSINSANGQVSGVPTVPGTYGFLLRVDDFAGTHVQTFCEITINCQLPEFFGAGCPGSAGCVPDIGTLGGKPCVGNLGFQVTLSNVRGGTLAVLLFGPSSTLGGGACSVGLPVPLSAHIGAGTCWLVVCPDSAMHALVGGLGDCAGTVQVPVPVSGWIPPGAYITCQWVVFDPGAPGNPGLTLSRGMRVTSS